MSDPALDFLNGKTFTAHQLCVAANINATSLTNIINKTKLELCSRRTRRGRARQFCLVDCYAIVIMDRLTKRVRDYGVAADAVNDLIFETARQLMFGGELSYRTDRELKDTFCKDIYQCTPELHYRNCNNPYYLIDTREGEWTVNRDYSPFIEGREDGAIVFDITFMLRKFDFNLARLCGFPVEKHYGPPSAESLVRTFMDGVLSAMDSPEESEDGND